MNALGPHEAVSGEPGDASLGVAATTAISAEMLTPLLKELGSESSCAHSWRPLLAGVAEEDLFERFQGILAADRPGQLFTYYRMVDGRREGLAFASVSERLSRTFPFDGIPVLARAFVRREARGKKLHAVMMRHRLDYCRARWGDRLLAVHVGTAAASIEANLRAAHAGLVTCLGDENLGEAGRVRALLALSDTFLADLSRSVPPGLEEPQRAVLDFLHQGAGARRISDLTSDLRQLGKQHQGFEQLDIFVRALEHLE